MANKVFVKLLTKNIRVTMESYLTVMPQFAYRCVELLSQKQLMNIYSHLDIVKWRCQKINYSNI